MRLLVTGATGFLGRYVVAEAVQQGHAVRAVVRPAADSGRLVQQAGPALEIARLDLRSRDGLVEALDGVGAVVHLAADKFGDFYTQFAANVMATENLLDAMAAAGQRRLVAVSTGSVYDLLRAPSGSTLSEDSRLEQDPELRDAYTRSKLLQEQLIRERTERDQLDLTVLRPGVVFGAENLWNAWLGARPSERIWVQTGARALVPLTYVENCAEAIVLAAVSNRAIGETLNIIDDELPTQAAMLRRLAQDASPRPTILPVAWSVLRLLAALAGAVNAAVFGGRAKLPGILVSARLHARAKPLQYSNRRAKEVLGWSPRFGLDEAIARSRAAEAAVVEPPGAGTGPPAVGSAAPCRAGDGAGTADVASASDREPLRSTGSGHE